jgi:cell division ATPase FtsA
MGVSNKKIISIKLHTKPLKFRDGILERKVRVNKDITQQDIDRLVEAFKEDWPLASSNLYHVSVEDAEMDA